MLAGTVETFDLLTERPALRIARVPVRGTPLDQPGPVHRRRRNRRTMRAWEVVLHDARPVEVARARALWDRSRFGVLPLTFTHPDDGEVAVVILDDVFRVEQKSAAAAEIRFLLGEWFG